VDLSVAGHAAEPPHARRLVDAVHSVRRRTPRVLIEAERRVLLVNDHRGQPGADVEVRLGERVHRTDAQGRVILGSSLTDRTPCAVAGVEIGRV
jgi:hypothetical protein